MEAQPIDPRVQQLKAVRRLIRADEARNSLIDFMQLTMPDPNDIEDATKTKYEVTPQGRLLCDIMQRVEKQTLLRSANSIGPQMGKSQIISRAAPAWIAGRNPYRHMILGSYNQDFANDFGQDVKTIMESSVYRQIFPGLSLASSAKDHLITAQGGKLAFVGVGGSGSGKPADLFVVDDPYRNADDANSTTYRERVWKWFNSVVFARCHDRTAIVIVHTRWHEDDLIGRLCDPNHPEREETYKGLAKRWTYINLPAVVQDEKLAGALGLTLEVPTDPDVMEQFGSRPMSALWPGRKSLPLMAEARQSDKKTFESLYMGRPAPDEGDYFTRDSIVEYKRDDLPKSLRIYGASDHAASQRQKADLNCIGCVGVDEDDHIWVLPDIIWRRMSTDRVVEEMLSQFERNKPDLWFMESELISKSFGPFLRKRMIEQKTYTTIDDITPSKDLELRARAIQGRMSLGFVHFPAFAPWWEAAKTQLLTFPSAAHDDFVAWLALIGQGLMKTTRPRKPKPAETDNIRSGSMEWLLRAAKKRIDRQNLENRRAGW